MRSIAIIGGGIIGLTLASYLDLTKYQVTIFDEGTGQATKASAGIISPWLSKRRNKQWYQLAKEGAAFFPKLLQDFQLDNEVYQKSGTLLLRKNQALAELFDLAMERRKTAPEIGVIQQLSPQETNMKLPLLKEQPALWISGGGRLDGKQYLTHLETNLQSLGVEIIRQLATVAVKTDYWEVQVQNQTRAFDAIAVCNGPKMKELLRPIGLAVDIRPQKGQLITFQTTYQESGQ